MKKLLLAAALALAACSSVSDTTFSFAAFFQPLDEPPDPPTVAAVGFLAPGVLSVTGGITLPCWEDLLDFDGARKGSLLQITILRVTATPCPDPRTRHFLYQGVFSAIPNGTYVVRVFDNTTGANTLVFEQSVTLD